MPTLPFSLFDHPFCFNRQSRDRFSTDRLGTNQAYSDPSFIVFYSAGTVCFISGGIPSFIRQQTCGGVCNIMIYFFTLFFFFFTSFIFWVSSFFLSICILFRFSFSSCHLFTSLSTFSFPFLQVVFWFSFFFLCTFPSFHSIRINIFHFFFFVSASFLFRFFYSIMM